MIRPYFQVVNLIPCKLHLAYNATLNVALVPFCIAVVGPGLIFLDDFARLHYYEYFHEGNDD